MNFINSFSLGLRSYSRALEFIVKHKLYGYFLYPLAINILLFAFGFSAIGELSDYFSSYFGELIITESWDFFGSNILAWLTDHIFFFFINIVLFILLYFIVGYIVLILLSPIYSILSEKTAYILSNKAAPFNLTQLLKEIMRGIQLAIRNLFIELGLTILLFIVSFIPFIGLFTTIALFLISSYFYGFSFIDYTLERRRFSAHESIQFVKHNKGLAMGNGFIFSIMLLIPYLGIFIAGFMSLISVVAATISTEVMLNDTNQSN